VVEERKAPAAEELEERLEGLRGEIELPIPAASAVKVGGERAYRLHRRGDAPEMPLRRSRVDVLDVIGYDEGIVRLDARVSSGTYIRAIADALGGHCRTLRRTEVGTFSVEDADEERVIPPAEALEWLPEVEVSADEAAAIRAGRSHAADNTRAVCDRELVAVGRVVMPA
jgi:tRNA pseudouridine55 synthase